MEVLTAASVPQVLKIAYDALLFSWTQYENVEGNQTQCHLLIQRCQDLFFEVNNQLSDLGLVGKISREGGLAAYLRGLEKACTTVKTTIGRLADKGFAWRLLNQDKIKEELATAETAIADALTIFNFGAHLSAQRLQLDIASAQKADQEELVARLDSLAYSDKKILAALEDDARRLDSLAHSDRKILAALQDDARRQRRLEESMLAFTKRYSSSTSKESHKHALQHLSRQPASQIPHWGVMGLQVIFNPAQGTAVAPSSAPNSTTLPDTVLRAKARYSYVASPDDPNDLSFTKGEILEILDRSSEWWQGRKADGTIGTVPSNFFFII
ncbi:Transmembrane osmosensor [Pleurotus pulmonarius]|nr:Transmembrane osmosensor [Pleurotus pulmonarius]